jgi:hypothetical protein
MSELPVVPLLSCSTDWEAEWDRANARFEAAKACVNAPEFRRLPGIEQARLQAEFDRLGPILGKIYQWQFQTSDAYRDWALPWLEPLLKWRPAEGFKIPSGLPMVEIRQRLDAAYAFRLAAPDGGPTLEQQSQILEILGQSPTPEVEALGHALWRVGGDRVRHV